MRVETVNQFGPATIKGTKKVWVSLITKSSYLPGLLTLDYSLKETGSKYPLVALYTDTLEDHSRKEILSRGIPMQHVETLRPSQHMEYSNDPRFYDTWTKLACFSLVQYERVGLLDCDMVVLYNIDELMVLPLDPGGYEGQGKRVFAASHACTCNPLKKSHYPKDWVRENCAFTQSEEDPDKSQKEGAPPSTGVGMINSGTVVLEPSQGAFEAILDKLQDSGAISSYLFPDQALLSDVFRDRWVALPYIYNALKTMREKGVHDRLWQDDKVKIVHYIMTPKPWDIKSGEVNDVLFGWWWDVNHKRLDDEKRHILECESHL
ncbi:hypothetical protein G7054_g2674 [Neopestalotiopsis clavispora]|nr:hypothetical protein G7054_g2674 [Neopestalotiopsis clavispora]